MQEQESGRVRLPSRREVAPPKETEIINPINKIFIDNRGEIAVRFAREAARRGIAAVVPYTDTEDDNIALEMARERADIGWEIVPLGGQTQDETYKNHDKILSEAIAHGCDAIALGYGFLAEDDAFVKKCEDVGMRVLAPPSEVMRRTGNKLEARRLVSQIKMGRFGHRIPVTDGTDNLPDVEAAVKTIKEFGYPVMLKDPETGGGAGNRRVYKADELEARYNELKSNPKCREIFAERLIEEPVHVEVQILADKYGNVVSLGERDCTMQRNSQKVIEESPTPHMNRKTVKQLERAAVLIAEAVGYENAGTIEFIYDRKTKNWYFMEINPRIQVEHPVTEIRTGINIAGAMIDIAEGRKLPFTQKEIKPEGFVMEARFYAENPDHKFTPSPGALSVLQVPEDPNVRFDAAYHEGQTISQWFDTTWGKAIARGRTREEVRLNLIDFMQKVKVAGVAVNIPYLIQLASTEAFIKGLGTTTFAETWWEQKLKDQTLGLGELINGGEFERFEPEGLFDISKLPQDVTVVRRSGKTESYSDLLKRDQERKGKESAAEFGIVRRDGIQFVLFNNDYGFRGGAFGVGESLVFRDAVKLAAERNIPLVTMFSSGGIEQAQNSTALQVGMDTAAADLVKYNPPLHINIYRGKVYGGVPAGPAGAADFQIGIDSEDTDIGFTGPYPIARAKGLEPPSIRAEDVYAFLASADPDEFEGFHSVPRHLQVRNIDIAPTSLAKASEKITHMIHVLGLEEAVYDPTIKFKPHEDLSHYEASASVVQHNRPGERLKAFFRHPFKKEYWSNKRIVTREMPVIYEDVPSTFIPITDRLRQIADPERPTTLDFIDTESGIFEDAVLLSEALHIQDGTSYVEQYPAVVAALAKIDGQPVMVIGHQTQLAVDGDKKVKEYSGQTPADWEYTERMMKIAEKMKLPLILMSDSTGADPFGPSEDHNQSTKISHTLTAAHRYPYPVISVGIGFGGSGGAKTFLRPVDAAADFEDAVTFVSQQTVQYWIESGRWVVDNPTVATPEEMEEMKGFLEQLRDALPEVKKDLGQIDEVLKGGLGGPSVNRQLAAGELKRFLSESLRRFEGMTTEELKERRYERADHVRTLMSKPNPAYKPEIASN